MAQVIKTTFQLRRGLLEAWEKNNPILAKGEPSFVIDKNALKIGDGVTPWKELEYIGLNQAGDDYVLTDADKAEIAGIAAGMVEVPEVNIVPSDWNAAEGEPGHVLNRTHWAEGVLVELLPETTLTTDDEGFADIAADFTLIAGDVYTVVYNGTAYQCTCVESDGERILANDGINEDTGEGLIFGIVQSAGVTFILSMTPGEVTLSIYHGGEIVHKLNNKYLNLDWLPVLEYDDIIPKTTVTQYMAIPGTAGIFNKLEVGQTLILIVDGVEYKTTVTQDLDGKYLEDYGTIRDPSNAQPHTLINGLWGFTVMSSYDEARFWGVEPGTHTIRLVSAAGNKNRIPESFIPDGYAKQEDIPTDDHIIELIQEHAPDSGGNADEVHVSDDEPISESVKVWIDTSDPEEVATGVYSVNGMTGDVVLVIPSIDGLATEEYVKEKLSNIKVPEGTYRLIETITLTESTTKRDFTTAPDGKVYAFDNVVVIIDIPAGDYESAVYYAQVYFGSTFISLYQETAPHATYKKRATFQFESRNGKMNAESVGFSSVYGSGDNEYTDGATSKASGDFRFAQPIKQVRVKSNKTLPVGTEIKIYGVVK